MESRQVRYEVNVVRGGHTALPILVGTWAGMAVMFALIALGVGVFLTLLALLGTMYLVISLLIYRAVYTLDESGIREEVVPYWAPFRWKKPGQLHFSWEQVKAYKILEDAHRYNPDPRQDTQKVIFTLYLKDPSYKIVFNNGKTAQSRESFARFLEEFLAKVKDINLEKASTTPGADIPEPAIVRKKSFYEKPVAKLITLVFIVATIWITYMLVQGYGSGASWFRLFLLLIPGTAYMSYRVFFRPRRKY